MMKPSILAVALLLAGCGTKYQETGLSGGVQAQQVTADTFRITARGNSWTRGTTVQDYVLLKAAETTRDAGATHFILTSSADASSVSYNWDRYGADQVVRPGQDAYIKIFRLQPGQQPPQGAQSAAEVIQFVGSRVQRG